MIIYFYSRKATQKMVLICRKLIGNTLLHIAISAMHLPIVSFLIKYNLVNAYVENFSN